MLGHISIRDLRPGAIQEAVNWLQLRGGVPTDTHPQGRPLAPKTVHASASRLFTCLTVVGRSMASFRVMGTIRPEPHFVRVELMAPLKSWECRRRSCFEWQSRLGEKN
jgi:hypothetical protein